MRNLVIIFGDQLNQRISSLESFDETQDHVFMMEVMEEATYVKHHKKKLAFILSAMRHFAEELQDNNIATTYVTLDDEPYSSFESALRDFLNKNKPNKIIITSPSEYRVLDKVNGWQRQFSIDVEIREDTRFLCSKREFMLWAKNKKKFIMEFFYREMRKKYQILVENNNPVGGQWNYDKDNRKRIPNDHECPTILEFKADKITTSVIKKVNKEFATHFGTTDNFHYAVTRADALSALAWFIKWQLPHFGDYQDAMVQNKPWLYHSTLSHYINIGLLLPKECIDAALEAYENEKIPINAVEGYIRQILGWREYVNGIYWLNMPKYKTLNALNANKSLPDFFWNGNTKLNCLKQCITDTYSNAYAHHIQRLMVIGNFCLLLGIHPDFVNEWYLIVYADAYEWVEMPNVTGMILFADEGLLGSKPYAASGAYINKMSNYCKHCHFNVKEKSGENACPFNYLYWYFLDKNKKQLSNNQRMNMIYSTLNKMHKDKVDMIRKDSEKFINALYQE